MWVIRHETSEDYFKDLDRGDPVWTSEIGEAMSFPTLEEEETYRGMNLPNENAQPFEVS